MEKFSMFFIGTFGLTSIFGAGFMIGDLEGGNALLLWIICMMVLSLFVQSK